MSPNRLRSLSLVISLLLLYTHAVSGACLATCDCHVTNNRSYVTCTDQSLNGLPKEWNMTAFSVDLQKNQISRLADVFHVLTDVEVVDLSSNNIQFVISVDFKLNRLLRTLNISNNNISFLGDNAFINIPKLQVLSLENNTLTTTLLTSAIFNGLADLRVLNLRRNALTSLPSDVFNPLSSLETLYLGYNHIKTITAASFLNVPKLTALYISHNLITNFNGSDIFSSSNVLQTLDLSHNKIEMLSNLTLPFVQHFDVSGNRLTDINNELFQDMKNLTVLNMNKNLLASIELPVFSKLHQLDLLSMSDQPDLKYLGHQTFKGLGNVHTLVLSHNPNLSFIHTELFNELATVSIIDLSFNNIKQLHNDTFSENSELVSLDLQGNSFTCDCSIDWILEDLQSNASIILYPEHLQCTMPTSGLSEPMLNLDIDSITCSSVIIVNYSSEASLQIGQSAILKCEAISDPSPEIIWITPRNNVLSYHDFHPFITLDNSTPFNYLVYNSSQDVQEKRSYYSVGESEQGRVLILQDGSLYIDYVLRSDAGNYKCIAKNPRNSTEVTIAVSLDYAVMKAVYVWSLVVGFSSAGSFFLLNLIYSLTLAAIRRCISQRRRERIAHAVETMDQYRAHQLNRIKENYTNQVGRIRDQYNYQLGRLREHQQHQMERMGRMRDGASQRMDKLRENYNNQLGKLKDYSSNQLVQLREKYNSQVDKIKDYGSVKLDRIHEKYKLKQQHVIKMLEMMNLDSCRTVLDSECIRAESMILQSDGFPNDISLQSPIDSMSISDSEYLTATSSESSIYTSQQNINLEDEDSQLTPMNPFNEDDQLNSPTLHCDLNAKTPDSVYYEIGDTEPSCSISSSFIRHHSRKKRYKQADRASRDEADLLCRLDCDTEQQYPSTSVVEIAINQSPDTATQESELELDQTLVSGELLELCVDLYGGQDDWEIKETIV
ncbi:leucine-rich repeat neuronal protein 1-like [Mya arenaria]|uniref:leucine-rich repeat neuronal protein 1-like n=1 Tax=Mya arenaria TaxID=6604 RepID=UPI0022DF4D62|nr:leucine-rich repeat neuronal protein 1-like [Mya arenaria]XP_052794229.1 leucine-rich repeat neuronal protein 1-like [Mya arenaria]XP_052794230.1 leucine-rich repeat neuronal protein 1-like [Mya arenaria]